MIATGDDAYLVVFDEQGAAMTGLQITGESTERIEAVAAALDGGTVVAGRFTNSMVAPAGDVFELAGEGDAFVMRVDETAMVRWVAPIGPHVGAVPGGGYLLAGGFEGTIAFDQVLTSAGEKDAFAALVR